MSKFIVHSFESNQYHDSYFYHVVIDTDAMTIGASCYASTAFGVEDKELAEMPHATEEQKDVLDEIVRLKVQQEIAEYKDIIVGDTVRVFKGRKFPKGSIATVSGFFDYKDSYGRVQGTYAITDIGNIPVGNIETVEHNPSEAMLKEIESQVRIYGRVRHDYAFKLKNFNI